MTEKQVYEVVRSSPDFELRRYPSHVVAEVVVTAPFEDAGNVAFRTLAGYIGGQNRAARRIAMTAPVVQQEAQQISMTAPVVQQETEPGGYAVAFVLPAAITLEDAPVPTDPAVTLHARPAVLAAARRYRGRWTRASFERHRTALDKAVREAGLTPVGAPRWARFDPPIVPAPLRRNEVVQDVTE
ncbi:SOUL family heme-binding protein [Ornithinimicrobium pekingense]|uniref:Heme-binding protein n=1 Tax=Ornithinimicrobium pekingense TaxID=384677 RepID=A0ABQ2F809_9MICO|nr:heme-binding protein [Ornithinimicrobium pekingense]GGK67881.1 hypothetical protein GCM10011509_15310 [Ornithinimicrobium pekingense]